MTNIHDQQQMDQEMHNAPMTTLQLKPINSHINSNFQIALLPKVALFAYYILGIQLNNIQYGIKYKFSLLPSIINTTI